MNFGKKLEEISHKFWKTIRTLQKDFNKIGKILEKVREVVSGNFSEIQD